MTYGVAKVWRRGRCAGASMQHCCLRCRCPVTRTVSCYRYTGCRRRCTCWCFGEYVCRLVTYGQNHIKFWRVGPDPRGPAGSLNPTSESGIYALGKTHSVLSAAFLPSGIVLTGKKSSACALLGMP